MIMTNETRDKLAAALLRKASDKFSRHGCSDYYLTLDAGLSEGEIAEVRESLRLHDAEFLAGEHVPEGGERADDWVLMDMLATRFEERPDEEA